MQNADVDRWCPNYADMGWSRAEAEDVAARAQELQDADPDVDWQHHLNAAIGDIQPGA